MTDLRKAAEMAATDLEELIHWHGVRDSNDKLMPAHNQTPEIKSAMESLEALRQALAQPEERGHCTCGDPTFLGYVHFRTRPCIYYTAPPKREWKGLTPDDKHFLLANAWNKEQAFDGFMEAIDKFLEEKNK